MQSRWSGLLQTWQHRAGSFSDRSGVGQQGAAYYICRRRGVTHGGGGGRGAGAGGGGTRGHTGPGGAGGPPRAGRKHETAPAVATQPSATSGVECRWHRPPPPVLFLKNTLAAQSGGFFLPPRRALHKQQHSSCDPRLARRSSSGSLPWCCSCNLACRCSLVVGAAPGLQLGACLWPRC